MRAHACRGTSSCKHSELLEHTPLEGVCIHDQRGETGGPVTETSFRGAILASRRWGHEAGDLG